MRYLSMIPAGLLILASAGLADAGPGKEELSALVQQLGGTDTAAREKAAAALEKLGPEAKEAVPELIGALKTDDVTVPPLVVRVLAAVGKAAVGDLAEALKDKKARLHALRALKRIGPDAKAAVSALADVVKDDKGAFSPASTEACEALGRIGPAAKEAVPVLIDAVKIKAPGSSVRLQAAIALGRIGPSAKDAVPALIEAVKEPAFRGPLRWHAATALGQIGKDSRDAIPALVEIVKDTKAGPARVVVVEALGEIGADPRGEAVDTLKEAAKDATLRDAATRALEKLQGKK
jgi:HEAT repeat protein